MLMVLYSDNRVCPFTEIKVVDTDSRRVSNMSRACFN